MSLQPTPAHSPAPAFAGRPDLRIGDADRDHACRLLTEHFSAGRLSVDEIEARLEAAVRSGTRGDLFRLLADLPTPPIHPQPSVPVPPARPRNQQPVAFDVLLGLIGVLAGLCLLGLFLVGGGRYAAFGIFACLGGAAVAAAVTHFVHRAMTRRSE